jgi:hypothetical protein
MQQDSNPNFIPSEAETKHKKEYEPIKIVSFPIPMNENILNVREEEESIQDESPQNEFSQDEQSNVSLEPQTEEPITIEGGEQEKPKELDIEQIFQDAVETEIKEELIPQEETIEDEVSLEKEEMVEEKKDKVEYVKEHEKPQSNQNKQIQTQKVQEDDIEEMLDIF